MYYQFVDANTLTITSVYSSKKSVMIGNVVITEATDIIYKYVYAYR